MEKYIGKDMKALNEETGTHEDYAGHCKAELQQLVSKTIGLWLPRNDLNPGKRFQWEQEGVKKLSEEKKMTQSPIFSSLEDINATDEEGKVFSYEMEGMIMQVLFDKQKIYNSTPWHTAIIIQHFADNICLLDCNYDNDHTVKKHVMPQRHFDDLCIAFRLYKIL